MGAALEKILRKKYTPDSMINQRLGTLDIAFRTDDAGDPVSAFVGKMAPDGRIQGNRFVRVMIKDAEGRIVKDFWEGKGRT